MRLEERRHNLELMVGGATAEVRRVERSCFAAGHRPPDGAPWTRNDALVIPRQHSQTADAIERVITGEPLVASIIHADEQTVGSEDQVGHSGYSSPLSP